MNVAHLDDDVINALECDQHVAFAYVEQLFEVVNDPLQLWVIKPRHLDDLCEQYNDHLKHLLLAVDAFVNQKIKQVILDADLFCRKNLRPVCGEQLFQR